MLRLSSYTGRDPGAGFEPALPRSERGVLPLDDPGMLPPSVPKYREKDSNLHHRVQSPASWPLDDPCVPDRPSSGGRTRTCTIRFNRASPYRSAPHRCRCYFTPTRATSRAASSGFLTPAITPGCGREVAGTGSRPGCPSERHTAEERVHHVRVDSRDPAEQTAPRLPPCSRTPPAGGRRRSGGGSAASGRGPTPTARRGSTSTRKPICTPAGRRRCVTGGTCRWRW